MTINLINAGDGLGTVPGTRCLDKEVMSRCGNTLRHNNGLITVERQAEGSIRFSDS